MQVSTSTKANAERQLAAFIRKFDPVNERLIRAVRKALRTRFPTANELVYDNYNFFVIGYLPTERPSDAIVSMAARADSVGLCFIHGARLPDPNKVLLGSGNQTRFIRIDSPAILERPKVKARRGGHRSRARTPADRGPREIDHPLRLCEAAAAQDTAATLRHPVIGCGRTLTYNPRGSAAKEIAGFGLSTDCRLSAVHRGSVFRSVRRGSQSVELSTIPTNRVSPSSERLHALKDYVHIVHPIPSLILPSTVLDRRLDSNSAPPA